MTVMCILMVLDIKAIGSSASGSLLVYALETIRVIGFGVILSCNKPYRYKRKCSSIHIHKLHLISYYANKYCMYMNCPDNTFNT